MRRPGAILRTSAFAAVRAFSWFASGRRSRQGEAWVYGMFVCGWVMLLFHQGEEPFLDASCVRAVTAPLTRSCVLRGVGNAKSDLVGPGWQVIRPSQDRPANCLLDPMAGRCNEIDQLPVPEAGQAVTGLVADPEFAAHRGPVGATKVHCASDDPSPHAVGEQLRDRVAKPLPLGLPLGHCRRVEEIAYP
jgi:hypothetical protein